MRNLGAALLTAGLWAQSAPDLVLERALETPVITVNSPGAGDNRHGFEGGRALKLDGMYHLFTSEMVGDPFWVKMKLAHWRSRDRLHWERVSTLYESSGEFEGKDPRAALWAPMPVYDEAEGVWNLFYVAYRSAPDQGGRMLRNHAGTICRAVSTVKGRAGIGGPYRDMGIILQPGKDSEPWEGLQGTDSFFPYRVGRRWLGFYGSAKTEKSPIEFWGVGLAEAPRLAGPWKRLPQYNPVLIDRRFTENPVVTRLPDGSYIAVCDTFVDNAVAYTWSADGLHWSPGRPLIVQPKGKGVWADDVRTPLGLIPEGGGRYTLFYTGYQKKPGDPWGVAAVGMVEVRRVRAQSYRRPASRF